MGFGKFRSPTTGWKQTKFCLRCGAVFVPTKRYPDKCRECVGIERFNEKWRNKLPNPQNR